MATNILTFQPAGIRASALPGNRKPEQTRRNTTTSWWTPLFGWSSEPDYIESNNGKAKNGSVSLRTVSDLDPKMSRSTRFVPGSFTAEKAKQLRMMTMETESFHDVMYHSAIASRLASDIKNNTSA